MTRLRDVRDRLVNHGDHDSPWQRSVAIFLCIIPHMQSSMANGSLLGYKVAETVLCGRGAGRSWNSN